eukprot:UN1286
MSMAVNRPCGISLHPADDMYDQMLMLRVGSGRHELPGAFRSLHTNGRAHDMPEKELVKHYIEQRVGSLLSKIMKHLDGIEREVRSQLDQLRTDNYEATVDQLALIELHSTVELKLVAKVIFEMALTNPQSCRAYYSVTIRALRPRYPKYPPENEIREAQTFERFLVGMCQDEFESSLEYTEEEYAGARNRTFALANIVGYLLRVKVMSIKSLGTILCSLIGPLDVEAPANMGWMVAECVCELLFVVGPTLDRTTDGKALVSQVSVKLQMVLLKFLIGSEEQRLIQNLLNVREAGWPPRRSVTLLSGERVILRLHNSSTGAALCSTLQSFRPVASHMGRYRVVSGTKLVEHHEPIGSSRKFSVLIERTK